MTEKTPLTPTLPPKGGGRKEAVKLIVALASAVVWIVLGSLAAAKWVNAWFPFTAIVWTLGLVAVEMAVVFYAALAIWKRRRTAAWTLFVWTLATLMLILAAVIWWQPMCETLLKPAGPALAAPAPADDLEHDHGEETAGTWKPPVAPYQALALLLPLKIAAALGLVIFLGEGWLLRIVRRETGSLFLSPIAWVVATAFLVAFGAIFSYFLIGSRFASMAPTFGILSLVMAFAIPMLTMRQIAEERRSGTIELLTTAPVTDAELVLGKFIAGVVFLLFLLLPTMVYVAVLYAYSTTGPDPWMLAAGYLGTTLLGMYMLSFGLFLSSVTREQIVSAVVGAFTLFLLWLLGFFLPANPPMSLETTFWTRVQEAASRVGGFLSYTRHMEPFGRGIVDSTEIVFFLSFTAFFLFLAVATVGTRKWR